MSFLNYVVGLCDFCNRRVEEPPREDGLPGDEDSLSGYLVQSGWEIDPDVICPVCIDKRDGITDAKITVAVHLSFTESLNCEALVYLRVPADASNQDIKDILEIDEGSGYWFQLADAQVEYNASAQVEHRQLLDMDVRDYDVLSEVGYVGEDKTP